MCPTKSLLFAIVARLDFLSDVYEFALQSSTDWIFPSVVALLAGLIIAIKSRKP